MWKVFLDLLKNSYDKLLANGCIDARAAGLIVIKLVSGLEVMADDVAKRKPITDWETFQTSNLNLEVLKKKGRRISQRMIMKKTKTFTDHEYDEAEDIVQSAAACIAAHRLAKESFKKEFVGNIQTTSTTAKLVSAESNIQKDLAEVVMKPDYNAEIKEIKTKCVSKVLLKKMIQNVYEYLDKGLLSQTETEKLSIRLNIE